MGNYRFLFPTPSMQCYAAVRAISRKQQTDKHPDFEWMGERRGVDLFVLQSLMTLSLTILWPIVGIFQRFLF